MNSASNPRVRWKEQDAQRGREIGARWARRAVRTGAIDRLAKAHYIAPGRHRPLPGSNDEAAYHLFVAMFGRPDIPEGESGAFIDDYIPSPVREFWEGLLGWDGSVELANQPAFAEAFLAAAMQIWEDSLP